MDQYDYLNVQNILRILAEIWGCSVQEVKYMLQKHIDESWKGARLMPERKQVWDQYFPDGKPSAEQYILWLGEAQERGEEMPYLLEEIGSEENKVL